MSTTVRVPKGPFALGGWKGSLEIDGDVLRVVGPDSEHRLDIDCSQVKRCSFNSNNGRWAFRMKDGRKLYVQTSGSILSADRTPEGRASNVVISHLLAKHGVRGFSV